MKKLTILAAVLFLGLSACKKDWTCKCEDDNGNVQWQTISNTTKSDAESLCNENEDGNVDCSLVGE